MPQGIYLFHFRTWTTFRAVDNIFNMPPVDKNDMGETHFAIAQRVANRFGELPEVEAVAIAGSQLTGTVSETSDIDVYVYPQIDIPAERRRAIALEFADVVSIFDVWGPGVEWDDPETGIHVDTMFFTASWMEDQIDRVLRRHEAGLGYSTTF
jgi:predicted nucleotidyltransferase